MGRDKGPRGQPATDDSGAEPSLADQGAEDALTGHCDLCDLAVDAEAEVRGACMARKHPTRCTSRVGGPGRPKSRCAHAKIASSPCPCATSVDTGLARAQEAMRISCSAGCHVLIHKKCRDKWVGRRMLAPLCWCIRPGESGGWCGCRQPAVRPTTPHCCSHAGGRAATNTSRGGGAQGPLRLRVPRVRARPCGTRGRGAFKPPLRAPSTTTAHGTVHSGQQACRSMPWPTSH